MLENLTQDEKIAAGNRPVGKLAVLLQRFGLRQQTLVVSHDVFIAALSLPIAFMLRHSEIVLSPWRLDYVLGALPLVVVTALVSKLVVGSHRDIWRYMGVPEIIRLGQFALLAVLLFGAGQFLVDRMHGMQRSILPLQFLVMMFLMLTSRIIYGSYLRWTEAVPTAVPAKPILLVGSGDGTALFIRMLGSKRRPEFEPVGILCDHATTNRSVAGVPVLGDIADFDRVVAKLRVQGIPPAQLVITRPHHELGPNPDLGYAVADRVIERARSAGIDVTELPDLMRFKDDTATRVAAVGDDLAADVYPRFKRAFDVVMSAAVLVFFSPLIAISAVAVACFIQRPVMFVQRRPGRGGKPFKLYKFRTMRDPVDSTGRTLTDAERTPLVGRFLRRSRFDELPQFWNVLIGDMAIIGPRPLLPADLDGMPDGGNARLRVKPGITGWGQVNGANFLSASERYLLDKWYIEHASIMLDLRIALLTARVMICGVQKNDAAIAMARAEFQRVAAE